MTSHHTQTPPTSFPGHIYIKRSTSNFETSKPPIKTWRAVGGIDESPLHPKHPQHPITTTASLNSATQLFNSRQFNKTNAYLHPPRQSTTPRNFVVPRNPSSSSFIRTHKITLSDSTAVSISHPYPTLNKPAASTLHHFEIPSIVDQTSISKQKQPPSSHSVVASLGLAPISSSIPSRHPFNLRPIRIVNRDPWLNSSHISPKYIDSSIDSFISFPQLPPIPSLLNPSRVGSLSLDQSHTQRDDGSPSDYTKFTLHSSYDTHDSPRASLEITAADPPPASNHPFQARSLTYSSLTRPIRPSPPSLEPLPQCESPVIVETSDKQCGGQLESSLLLPGNKLPERSIRPPDDLNLFFEPAGKAFVKYTLPKPRLNANKWPQPPNLNGHSLNITRNPDSNPKIPLINSSASVPKRLRNMSSHSSLEELRYRYWNSKHRNYDRNQVWAEMYISKLERKIWNSEAEHDYSSVDCLKFCTTLGSNNKAVKAHRRTSSAPDLKHLHKPTPPPIADRRGNKTHPGSSLAAPLRSKLDHPSARKPFPMSKILSNLMNSCPSTPLNMTSDSMDGITCTNPKPSSTTNSTNLNVPQPGSLTRLRTSSAPRPIMYSQGDRRDAASNNSQIIQESGYRIVIPNASSAVSKYPKTLWRQSRSVPNLRDKREGMIDSSHDATETSQSYYSLDKSSSPVDPNLPKIPQNLIDAMFPPTPGSKEKSASFPPESVPSTQSQSGHMPRTSDYATVETHSDYTVGFHPEITQTTDSESKGPLHSLPRFIEPRSNVIIALPPPPRKRTVTPVASTDSPHGTSVSGTKRSTSQSVPSYSSWGTPSRQTHSHSLSPSPIQLKRRLSPALGICNQFPKTKNGPTTTSPPVIPRLSASMLDTHQPPRSRSLSEAHQISPSIESEVDSVQRHRHSGLISEPPSRLCSLDLHSALIHEKREFDSLPAPSHTELPFSTFRFDKHKHRRDGTMVASKVHQATVEEAQDRSRAVDNVQPEPCPNTLTSNICSSLSSPSGSSHSVIDPDVYINQADLFYQMPASPQRDLIEDYDNRIFKSMLTRDTPVASLSSSTHGKQSRLIDQILAGYNDEPRAKKSLARNQSHDEKTDQMVTEAAFMKTQDQQVAWNSPQQHSHSRPGASTQTHSWCSAKHRIPEIVDAFEARLSGTLLDDERNKNEVKN